MNRIELQPGIVIPSLSAVAIDTETSGDDPQKDQVRLVQFCDVECSSGNVNVYLAEDRTGYSALNEIMEGSSLKILQNGKFDLKFLKSIGIDVGGAIFDTMLASQLLNCGARMKHDLKSLAQRHLGIKIDKSLQSSFLGYQPLTDAQKEYGAIDVVVLGPLKQKLEQSLAEARLSQIAALEFKLLPILASLEWQGLHLDCDRLDEMIHQVQQNVEACDRVLQSKIATNITSLFSDAPTQVRVDLNRPKALKQALTAQGIEVKSVKSDDLIGIEHPVIEELLRYQTAKQQLKEIEKIRQSIHPKTERLHPRYSQCSEQTWGGLSHSRLGIEEVRNLSLDWIRPSEGYQFFEVRYPNLELQVLAALSECARELDRLSDPLEVAVAYGVGVHQLKGIRLMRYAWQKFGILLTKQEAKAKRQTFLEQFPAVEQYHQSLQIKRRKAINVIGRQHHWQFAPSGSERGRFLIQSAANDVIKSSACLLSEQFGTSGRVALILNDRLIVEVSEAFDPQFIDLKNVIPTLCAKLRFELMQLDREQ